MAGGARHSTHELCMPYMENAHTSWLRGAMGLRRFEWRSFEPAVVPLCSAPGTSGRASVEPRRAIERMPGYRRGVRIPRDQGGSG